MGRLARWILCATTVLSGFASVGALLLNVRARGGSEMAGYSRQGAASAHANRATVDWAYYFTSSDGVVALTHFRDEFTDPATVARQGRPERDERRWFWQRYPRGQRVMRADGRLLGFGFNSRRNVYPYGTNENWTVCVPAWFLAAAGLILPATWIVRRRAQRRRRGMNACAACGYDLTGSESGVCPECGLRVAAV